MKLTWLSFVFFSCSCVNAQYFSEGWKPGQRLTTEAAAAAPSFTPQSDTQSQSQAETGSAGSSNANANANTRPQNKKGPFDLSRILSSEPVANLFAKAGVNITERLNNLEEQQSPWDLRIPFLTDENYGEMIVDERLEPEEERDRTWVVVVSAASNHQGGLSQMIDEIFDEAFNETLIAGDIPNLRWARIDYLNVTYLTTKWGLWQAPSFVIIKDRGESLRFYRPQHLRLRDGAFREFLKGEYYLQTPPWSSSFAPNGRNEYIMHYFALTLTKIYNAAVLLPKWLLYIISGSLASLIIQFLHKPSAKAASQTQARVQGQRQGQVATQTPAGSSESKPAGVSASASGSGSVGKSGGAKQRKIKSKK